MPDIKFQRIFLHCSDSEFGSVLQINQWHIERGWAGCGYHQVIQNGFPTKDWYNKKNIIPFLEGAVEVGRLIDDDKYFDAGEIGAGVQGWNTGSFHICMIGTTYFSNKVLNTALEVVKYYCKLFELTYDNVLGHCEKDSGKTCPNINMVIFRNKLKNNELYGELVKLKVEAIVNNSVLTRFKNLFIKK